MNQKKEKKIEDSVLSDWCNLAVSRIFNSDICFIICIFKSFL